jgi:hypothetical protein
MKINFEILEKDFNTYYLSNDIYEKPEFNELGLSLSQDLKNDNNSFLPFQILYERQTFNNLFFDKFTQTFYFFTNLKELYSLKSDETKFMNVFKENGGYKAKENEIDNNDEYEKNHDDIEMKENLDIEEIKNQENPSLILLKDFKILNDGKSKLKVFDKNFENQFINHDIKPSVILDCKVYDNDELHIFIKSSKSIVHEKKKIGLFEIDLLVFKKEKFIEKYTFFTTLMKGLIMKEKFNFLLFSKDLIFDETELTNINEVNYYNIYEFNKNYDIKLENQNVDQIEIESELKTKDYFKILFVDKNILKINQDDEFLLNFDVDSCIFNHDLNHISTINAFSYILKGKKEKKFVDWVTSSKLALIIEFYSKIYIYDMNLNEKDKKSKHQVITLEHKDEELLGYRFDFDQNLYILTTKHFLRIKKK